MLDESQLHEILDYIRAEKVRRKNPYAKKGWSGTAKMTVGQSKNVALVQANFEENTYYTVQFNLLFQAGGPAGPGVPLCQATIVWSVEGNNVQRIVNVGAGVEVSGSGQALDIHIDDITKVPAAFLAAVPTPTYTVSASVTKGTRAVTETPPTLVATNGVITPTAFTVAAGGTTDIPIPDNSGTLTVFTTCADPAGAAITEGTAQVSHVIPAAIVLKLYDARIAIWVPITPGTQIIRLKNNGAVPLTFSVTFGIDG